MNHNRLALFVFGVAPLLFGGCMPKMTVEKLAAMRVEKPSQLDQLRPFVGKWEWNGQLHVAGMDEPLAFTGHSETSMEDDGWHLLSRETGDIKGMGHTIGLGTWAYDIQAGLFRTTWLDSMGSISIGTARYNEKTQSWKLRAVTRSPHGSITGVGRIEFTGPDTMNWDWADYVVGGLIKVMEFKGQATRVE